MSAKRDDPAFAERVALFSSAMTSTDVPDLLLGLAEPVRDRASAFLSQLSMLDSGARQARLTLEFGWRSDALSRLQTLIVEAPPALRGVIGDVLPAQYAPHFPHLRRGAKASPALRDLAARLVREAVRT